MPDFDHSTTSYRLCGTHVSLTSCTQCHTKLVFNYVDHTCADCRSDIHHGQRLQKVTLQQKTGMKSPAALALCGPEYPLELNGIAWSDPESGSIAKIEAGIANTLQDVGLKTLNSEIDFAPLTFADPKHAYGLSMQARVQVETARQHWRNLHHSSASRNFLCPQEKVTQK